MSDVNIESVIDNLLVFMVDEMERIGDTVNATFYNFEPNGTDRLAFISVHPTLQDSLDAALNVCLSRQLIARTCLGSIYDNLRLSIAGQARGLSVKLKKPEQVMQPTFSIGTITSHGPMQIGTGNTMSIDTFYADALARIESFDAPQEQKNEAKSILARTLEHPLLCAVLGGIVGGLTSSRAGG